VTQKGLGVIALSTAWYSRSKPRLAPTLEAIARMGFEAVEIGVTGVVPFRMKEARKALKATSLKVVSVHNICTERKLEPSNRRGDWLASADEEQRRQGVEATLDSIANAKALGASAVVLHLGATPVAESWEKQSALYRLVREGAAAAVQLGVSREGILAERAAHAGAQLDAACRSLAELLDRSSGVRLGIECRLGWHELPSLDELGVLLDRFPNPRVGYWHDVGHAVVQDFLGLANQYDWLRRHGRRTLGIHVHDVRERTRDHYPPGLGEVDFGPLAALVPADALCVMEISADFIAEEIALSKRRLEEMGLWS